MFGGLETLAAPTRETFEAYRAAADALSRFRQLAAEGGARQELAAFQLAELEKAGLKSLLPGESDEDLALLAARQVLASAERVERLCAEGYASLYESDAAVLSGLGAVWKRVGELAAMPGSSRTRRATASSRSSKTSRTSCADTATASMRRRRGSSKSKSAWRCSSGSSGMRTHARGRACQA
jgi:DNA repair ATPase RecN